MTAEPRETRVPSGSLALGAAHELAVQLARGAGHWWRHSGAGLNRVLTVTYLDTLGFPRLA